MCQAALRCVCYFYEIKGIVGKVNSDVPFIVKGKYKKTIACHPIILPSNLTSRKRSTVSVTADHNHLVWKGKVDINDIAVR